MSSTFLLEALLHPINSGMLCFHFHLSQDIFSLLFFDLLVITSHILFKMQVVFGYLSCYWSVSKLCSTLCDSMDCSTPSFPILHYVQGLLKLMCIWVSKAIQPSLFSVTALFFLQSFPASESYPMNWLFTSGGQRIGASASVLPKNIQGWFVRIDWLDLLAVQGTFKSLLQHHNSKASVLQHSAFFQLSRPYMSTRKTIALTKWTFVGKGLC